MPIEIKQLSIRSNVITEQGTSSQNREDDYDGLDNDGRTLSEASAQHTVQFQTMKWIHRKLKQETRER